jgi:hypothetical protein
VALLSKCARIHTLIREYTHPYTHASAYIRIRAYSYSHIRASAHTRIRAYQHPHTHASTHRCIHAHTHSHAANASVASIHLCFPLYQHRKLIQSRNSIQDQHPSLHTVVVTCTLQTRILNRRTRNFIGEVVADQRLQRCEDSNMCGMRSSRLPKGA